MNYLFSCQQWYGGIFLFMPSVERWYMLSSVVRRYIFSYHQWHNGVISVNGRLAFQFRMHTFSSPVKEDVPLFSSPVKEDAITSLTRSVFPREVSFPTKVPSLQQNLVSPAEL